MTLTAIVYKLDRNCIRIELKSYTNRIEIGVEFDRNHTSSLISIRLWQRREEVDAEEPLESKQASKLNAVTTFKIKEEEKEELLKRKKASKSNAATFKNKRKRNCCY